MKRREFLKMPPAAMLVLKAVPTGLAAFGLARAVQGAPHKFCRDVVLYTPETTYRLHPTDWKPVKVRLGEEQEIVYQPDESLDLVVTTSDDEIKITVPCAALNERFDNLFRACACIKEGNTIRHDPSGAIAPSVTIQYAGYTYVGCRGSFFIEIVSGSVPTITFTLRGQRWS